MVFKSKEEIQSAILTHLIQIESSFQRLFQIVKPSFTRNWFANSLELNSNGVSFEVSLTNFLDTEDWFPSFDVKCLASKNSVRMLLQPAIFLTYDEVQDYRKKERIDFKNSIHGLITGFFARSHPTVWMYDRMFSEAFALTVGAEHTRYNSRDEYSNRLARVFSGYSKLENIDILAPLPQDGINAAFVDLLNVTSEVAARLATNPRELRGLLDAEQISQLKTFS